MVRRLFGVVLAVSSVVVVFHTIIRIVRHFYKLPMPEFLANAIDNPLRRRIQPPEEMPLRHGIGPGMRVLEVGPGNGRYTVATARRVGAAGRVVTVDIEPRMLERVQARAEAEGIANVGAWVTSVCSLPFADETFDAIYMITVIGEIPKPLAALKEFYRVLSPSGTVAFSELVMDPDYPLAKTLVRYATMTGYRLRRRVGSFFSYSLVFQKDLAD